MLRVHMSNLSSLSAKAKLYKKEINYLNFLNMKKFTLGGMILTGPILLVSLLFHERFNYSLEYGTCFLVFIIGIFYTRFVLKNHISWTLASFYALLVPIYAMGILMGTFDDSENRAITIMIMLCTLTMFITDNPYRVLGFLLAMACAFALCSFLSKSLSLFSSDLINLVIYSSIGIGVNMLALSDRIQNLENYAKMYEIAAKDPLTSLLNRRSGDQLMRKALSEGKTGSLIMIDIDDFKKYNDLYGHDVGDEVICKVAFELEKAFKSPSMAIRLGGDEFIVLAIGLDSRLECEGLLRNMQDSLHRSISLDSISLDICLSVGCVIFKSPGYQLEQLYKLSDRALYESKDNGKNSFTFKEIS